MAPLWMAMRISCGLLLIRDASLAYPVVTSLGKYGLDFYNICC